MYIQHSPFYPLPTTHYSLSTMPTDSTGHELPKQYDHAAAQQRWYPFWEERGYFHSEPDPTRQPYASSSRRPT